MSSTITGWTLSAGTSPRSCTASSAAAASDASPRAHRNRARRSAPDRLAASATPRTAENSGGVPLSGGLLQVPQGGDLEPAHVHVRSLRDVVQGPVKLARGAMPKIDDGLERPRFPLDPL